MQEENSQFNSSFMMGKYNEELSSDRKSKISSEHFQKSIPVCPSPSKVQATLANAGVRSLQLKLMQLADRNTGEVRAVSLGALGRKNKKTELYYHD